MFESSLISLDRKKKPARRRWLSLPIAVALHLVALATFTLAGTWHVDRVPEPPSHDVYMIEASLPELPVARIKKGSDTPPPTTQKAPEPPRNDQAVQPKDTPETLPPPAPKAVTGIVPVDLPPGPGDPRGVDDGDPHGDVKGVIGAPWSASGTKEAAAPVNEAPIYLTAAMTRPVFLDGPQPRYTEMARKAGTQGAVIVEAIVDEQGRVTNVKLVKPLPLGLAEAAMDAVRSWHFKPATLGGRAVKVYYTLTVNFTLQR
jgi:periplasmic protein TonB